MTRPTNGGAIKVLMAAQYLDPEVGGAERYAREVGDRLAARGTFELSFLASDVPTGLSPAQARLWTTGYHLAWPREVGAALDRIVPDVLYVHHTVPGLTDVVLRQAAGRQLPVALMYHSDVTGPEPYKRWLGELYGWMIGRRSLAVPAVFFVPSQVYVRNSPVLRKVRTRIVEAPPGVDPVMRTGSPRQRRYLLFVGKPEIRKKGVDVLLAAWRRIRDEWPDHELVVVGGRRVQEVDSERVRRTGRASREALADLYAGADVTVLPSLTDESFGMVLAEALVAGCPIVASDVGGVRTLVDEGRNGRLVPPGDVAALEAALRDLLEHRERYRSFVAEQGEAYARRFDWESTVDIVAEELLGLVHERAVPSAAAGERA